MTRVALPDGVSLNTRVDGPEGGPWIILSNSLGANLAMWDGQMDMLTRKYRVLRYDQRGHGASDAPTGRYSFDLMVADVIALMDHYGIEKADWLGLSMGAMTGMGLAIHHPDRFGKMILADGRAVATDGYKAMWDQRVQAIGEGGLEAVVEGSLGLWLTESWRKANPEATDACRAMILATPPEGYIASCYALRELDYLKDLGDLTLPVLYICGAEDHGAPPEEMQEMAKATPGSKYAEIPCAAHVANINQPKAFNAAVASFLEI
ncbi:3-oxoadipate enol-lactonase [Pelagibacterium montanilacus]|uniref:3-oxoadipate enol-lactonase n=1 Tax=Pelagibacterium montanilacus TaxID=2185280 RepID=UPI0013DE8A57|nr:3-oxoadipate enol-lactonase [Pelagibacterium montanilacus]